MNHKGVIRKTALHIKDLLDKETAEITIYLALRGFVITEGPVSPDVFHYLIGLTQRSNARLIGETGFNAGFSSYAFLKTDPEIKVTSFDLGEHKYVKAAKEFIDEKFPGRHTLIYGDSKESLSKFARENRDTRFDLVFIDGGHDYETAKSDIVNFRPLCTEKTVVVMDDLNPWFPWGRGPTQAWTEAIQEGLVIQEELIKDGKQIDKIEPPGERIWAIGRYKF